MNISVPTRVSGNDIIQVSVFVFSSNNRKIILCFSKSFWVHHVMDSLENSIDLDRSLPGLCFSLDSHKSSRLTLALGAISKIILSVLLDHEVGSVRSIETRATSIITHNVSMLQGTSLRSSGSNKIVELATKLHRLNKLEKNTVFCKRIDRNISSSICIPYLSTSVRGFSGLGSGYFNAILRNQNLDTTLHSLLEVKVSRQEPVSVIPLKDFTVEV